MNGLIDIHLHILPNVDDGSKSIEDSIEMARVLVQCGFSELAPSPHNQPQFATKDVALQRLEELKIVLDEKQIEFKFHQNSENAFFADSFLHDAISSEARTIGQGTKYLLVEPPHHDPFPSLVDAVFRLKLKGITPVIAHPERCVEFLKKDKAQDVVRAGALLQLDVGALTGRYGPIPQKLSRSFLHDGLYVVAASDLHGPKNAEVWLPEAMEALLKEVGAATFQKMMADVPRALLNGHRVDSL